MELSRSPLTAVILYTIYVVSTMQPRQPGKWSPVITTGYTIQTEAHFMIKPNPWNWGYILSHMLCPSTWSSREAKSIGDQSSETSRWVQYEWNTFSTSSNNDRTRFFIILILSSLLPPNFKRRSYHRLADTDLWLATNDSCSTVHCVSLKSFLRTCVTEGFWSDDTLSSEGRESRRVRGRTLSNG
jgi:hypothetical protein